MDIDVIQNFMTGKHYLFVFTSSYSIFKLYKKIDISLKYNNIFQFCNILFGKCYVQIIVLQYL